MKHILSPNDVTVEFGQLKIMQMHFAISHHLVPGVQGPPPLVVRGGNCSLMTELGFELLDSWGLDSVLYTYRFGEKKLNGPNLRRLSKSTSGFYTPHKRPTTPIVMYQRWDGPMTAEADLQQKYRQNPCDFSETISWYWKQTQGFYCWTAQPVHYEAHECLVSSYPASQLPTPQPSQSLWRNTWPSFHFDISPDTCRTVSCVARLSQILVLGRFLVCLE